MIRSAEASSSHLTKDAYVSCIIIIVETQSLSFITPLSMTAPMHSKPASAKTAHDNNQAHGNNK